MANINFTSEQTQELIQHLKTVLFQTELSGRTNKIYNFSNAGIGNSGYTFGVVQFDLKTNSEAKSFLQNKLGFTSSEVMQLGGSANTLNSTLLSEFNQRLLNNRFQVDDFTYKFLESKVGRLDALISQVRTVNPSVADAIMNDPKLQMKLMDYDNQFGISGIGTTTLSSDDKMMHYLYGENVAMNTGTSVKIGSAGLNIGGIDDFIAQTKYGTENKAAVESRNDRFEIGIKFAEINHDASSVTNLIISGGYLPTWTVGSGVTIDNIVASTGVTLEQFQLYNLGKDLSNLKLGDVLTIPPVNTIFTLDTGIGMMNTYNLATGEIVGKSTTTNAPVYPNYNPVAGADVSASFNLIQSQLVTNSLVAYGASGLRGISGGIDNNYAWGGNILLQSESLSLQHYTSSTNFVSDLFNNASKDFTGFNLSKIYNLTSNSPFYSILASNGYNGYYPSLNGKLSGSSPNQDDSSDDTFDPKDYQNNINQTDGTSPIVAVTTPSTNTSSVLGSGYVDPALSAIQSAINSATIINAVPASVNIPSIITVDVIGFGGQFGPATPPVPTISNVPNIVLPKINPIVLDLNGDGIQLIDRNESNAYFDLDGSGYRNHIGWVAPEDGILVIDVGLDNIINQTKEISFSKWTDNPDSTDLEGLKATFDNNHDDVIDKDDAVFSNLRVWQDLNGNGISENGELHTLSELNITSIGLNSVKTDWSSGGNSIYGFSTYTKTTLDSHGYQVTSQGYVGDVAFGYDMNAWKAGTNSGGLVTIKQGSGLTYALSDSANNLAITLSTGVNGAFGNSGNDVLTAYYKSAAVLEGGAGNDILTGSYGDDWLNGGTGKDTLLGGNGDDTLVIDGSDDLTKLDGGIGYDTAIVSGDSGVSLNLSTTNLEAVIGGDGNDNFSFNPIVFSYPNAQGFKAAMFGGFGNDTISAGSDDDILQGGSGNDTLYGNLGNDAYLYSRGDGVDTIVEWSASTYQSISSTATNGGFNNSIDLLLKAFGLNDNSSDTIIFGAGITANDLLIATSGNNILIGLKPEGQSLPNSVNNMSTLAAYIQGLSDNITIVNGNSGYYKIEKIGFADGGIYSLDRWLQGTSITDSLVGSEFSDVLTGGSGGDALYGGAGDDLYVVDKIAQSTDNSKDVVVENPDSGNDTVLSTVTYTLTDNVENLKLLGNEALDGTGNVLNNRITGNSGNNHLYGNAGNDILDGATGNDTLLGGAGDDKYFVDSSNDVVTEITNEGSDTVYSKATSYTLGQQIENITLLSGGIEAIGNNLDNYIVGNSADNTLNGGAGQDTLVGGTGNDTYVIDTAGDLLKELTNQGNDTVKVTFNYKLLPNFENLILSDLVGLNGQYALNATGNTLNNYIAGNSRNNLVTDGAGGKGNDTLDGGVGADTMVGGVGNDVYIVDDVNDVVKESKSQGTDAVVSTLVYYTLANNVENLVLGGTNVINGTGNSLNNSLFGNTADNVLDGGAGKDTLNGGTGRDTLIGGAGNDTYIVGSVGDVVTETDSVTKTGGIDTVLSNIDYTLGDNVENLTLTNNITINGMPAIKGTGNALNNSIKGNDADNILNGMAGIDAMAGGLGDDTYYFDNLKDVATEAKDAGIDTIISSVNVSTLAAYVENLTLTGTATTGYGNTLNNYIKGNDVNNSLYGSNGDDTIDGGLGADTMSGGVGNDTFYVDSSSDSVSEAAGAGTDTVISNISYTLSSNLENIILTETVGANGLLAKTAIGNQSNNLLVGNSDNNVLNGGSSPTALSGNDTLDGGAGNDTMTGGDGNDTYIVDSTSDVVVENITKNEGTIDLVKSSVSYVLGKYLENLTLTGLSTVNGTGNESNNYLIGNVTANFLSGEDGNDTLDGGVGVDTLAGGTGNDTYYVDSASDVIKETDANGLDLGGIETVFSSSRNYVLSAHLENLTMLLNSEALTATGNEINNTIIGNAAANTIDGGLGDDTLTGGLGDDTYYVDSLGDKVTEATNGGLDTVITNIDSYVLTSYVENLTLAQSLVNGIIVGPSKGNGNSLNNVITGNELANTLLGGAGDDTLNGGKGIDSMEGDLDDDTYYVDNINDIVKENANVKDANGVVIKNYGVDTVKSLVTWTLGSNVENLTLIGTDNINGTGNTLSNVLTGNTANNYISGDAGNDTLDGGGGIDILAGGSGNDLYIVQSNTVQVLELASEGTDTVQSNITYILTDNVENLTLTGSEDINGTGNSIANTIIGNNGDNIIDGGSGADSMKGGMGDDTYYVDYYLDVITENADTIDANGNLISYGIDTEISSVTDTLLANIENLILTGDQSINGAGNSLDNRITGNGAANSLNGMQGDDSLFGGLGNDTLIGGNVSTDKGNDWLDGGVGADSMVGGAGNDIYIIDDIGDVVSESANTTDSLGAVTTYGIDLIRSSITLSLLNFNNVENLTLTGSENLDATGNTLNNVLTGNSGINKLTGGKGNDTYIVDNIGDTVIENLNEGTDAVQSSISYTLGANVENLILTSISAISGIGNDLNNSITGSDAANTLTGAAGNDVLDGGLGIDSLIGGLGNDVFYVDDEDDVVSENLDEGTDIVYSTAVTYALSANIENLTLSGTGDNAGTGNSLDNTIIGNIGANLLDGKAGADTMKGGLGDDVYIVDDINDSVLETTNQGTDRIESSVDYRLSTTSYVENLTLLDGALSGIGNLLDNYIIGNSDANYLSGSGGDDTLDSGASTVDGSTSVDTMDGGSGNDTFIVHSSTDVITEKANTTAADGTVTSYGIDTVVTSITWTLGANLEYLVLVDDENINGTGNTLANSIIGNSGNNYLTGLSGNDTLDGGEGDDTLDGGEGSDTYYVDSADDIVIETGTSGTDIVNSTVSYTLGGTLEQLVLVGEDNIDGTGNSSNNKLTGNDFDNILTGGAGVDTMIGGLGNDTYYVDSASDVIQEGLDEGIDKIYSSISLTVALAANVENIELTGLATKATGNSLNNYITGNELANTLSGGAGDDTMDGGTGIDSMAGSTGNDTYYVDNAADVVTESANTTDPTTGVVTQYGIDTVISKIASYVLGSNVENLTLDYETPTAISGTGNLLANILTGNSSNNLLTGAAGNDTLDGGAGNDTMDGGAGNDIYVIDSDQDVIINETDTSGIDTVKSYITILQLMDNVENLTLIGNAENDATGNGLNNLIIGNDAGNVLNGGLGKDTLIGGKGDDSYLVDVDNDIIIENDGEGTDTVFSLSNYTLAANLENLVLTGALGSEGINATGNDRDNLITGNSGDNVLTGLDGNDTLDGGGGLDTLIGGLGDDSYKVYAGSTTVITENLDEGADSVYSQISYTLGDNLENLTLTSNLSINGTGNALNNNIVGNDANNTLNGLGGSNILTGGNGQDIFMISVANSFNTITDFNSLDDTIQISKGIYASLNTLGVLNASSFAIGAGLTAATDANDYLIYNSSTGALYYDELGNTVGSSSAVQIASLTAGLSLTNNDFVIV